MAPNFLQNPYFSTHSIFLIRNRDYFVDFQKNKSGNTLKWSVSCDKTKQEKTKSLELLLNTTYKCALIRAFIININFVHFKLKSFNLQKEMEISFKKFSHLNELVFNQLDNESLVTCMEVDRSWKKCIDSQKLPWIRMIEKQDIYFACYRKE